MSKKPRTRTAGNPKAPQRADTDEHRTAVFKGEKASGAGDRQRAADAASRPRKAADHKGLAADKAATEDQARLLESHQDPQAGVNMSLQRNATRGIAPGIDHGPPGAGTTDVPVVDRSAELPQTATRANPLGGPRVHEDDVEGVMPSARGPYVHTVMEAGRRDQPIKAADHPDMLAHDHVRGLKLNQALRAAEARAKA